MSTFEKVRDICLLYTSDAADEKAEKIRTVADAVKMLDEEK